MKNILPVIIILSSVFYVSCKIDEPSYTHKYNKDPQYTWGYGEFYGAYYAGYGNENNVVSLSLFSDSLSINSTGSLAGTGQYLYLEDIFISPADSVLPAGTYTSSESHSPMTFSPGIRYVVDDTKYTLGATIYFKENPDTWTKLLLISRGSFTVSKIGLKQQISCNFILEDSTVLKGTYTGKLQYADQRFTASKTPRRKVILKSED